MTVVVPAMPTPVPQRSDPINFPARADAVMVALPGIITAMNTQNAENNAMNENVNTKHTQVVAYATPLNDNIDMLNDIHWALPTILDVAAIVDEIEAVGSDMAAVTTVAANMANILAALADLPSLAAKVSKTGDTMTGGLTVPSLNGGHLAGQRRRNRNGDVSVAQRVTSQVAASGYILDGWRFETAGGTVATVSQAADGPPGFDYSHRVTITTADTSVAAADYVLLSTHLEGHDVRDFFGSPFVVGFWVRAPVAGTYTVALRNSGVDRTFVHEYTVSVADTWEFKYFALPTGFTSGGTWNKTNGVGLRCAFVLTAGSTFHTTPESWQVGSGVTTANQVNAAGAVSNIFAITGLQIEPGLVPTPYERLSRQAELTWNQRFFCKSYEVGTPPATANNETSAAIGVATTATRMSTFVRFPVEMCSTPSSLIIIGSSGTVGQYSPTNSYANAGAASGSPGHSSAAGFQEIVVAGATPGTHYQFHWMASAES